MNMKRAFALKTDIVKHLESPDGDILVIGAEGMLGRHLVDLLERTGKVVWQTSRRPEFAGRRRMVLDLAGDAADWQLPSASLAVAVICAAVPSLALCGTDPEASARVNVSGTVTLASLLVAREVFTIFPSSNLVFEGARSFRGEHEPVCPRTEYGRQKALAEQRLLSLGEKVAVVRFAKILSPDLPLIKGWIDALRSGREIYAFSDAVIAPVTASFAVEVLRRISEKRSAGVFHVSGNRDISYVQVAQHLASRLDADPGLVVPVSSQSKGVPPEAVPTHTTLNVSRIRSVFGMRPPDVWEAIDTTFDLV